MRPEIYLNALTDLELFPNHPNPRVEGLATTSGGGYMFNIQSV